MAFGGDTAESYYDEGLTASMKGDVSAAVQYFQKAIHMDNSMSSAYHQLGKCYARMGNYDGAAELIAQVVKKRPKQIPPRLDLGHVLLQMGKYPDARHQFDQIMALQPGNQKAQLGLARVDFEQGNWDGAMAQTQAAIALGSGANFAALFLLGRAAKLAGDPVLARSSLEKAAKLIEKSIEMSPDAPEGYFLKGEVAFVQEEYAAALDGFRRAEDFVHAERLYAAYGENFSLADILAKEGLCLQRMGQNDRARDLGERIGKLDPNHKLGEALRNA